MCINGLNMLHEYLGGSKNFSITFFDEEYCSIGVTGRSFCKIGCDHLWIYSVQNMQRLHEYGQGQLFDLRTQSGVVFIPLLSKYLTSFLLLLL